MTTSPITTNTYDSRGNVLTSTADSDVIIYAYDGRGNVVHTLNPEIIDLYFMPFYGKEAPFSECDINNDGLVDFTDLMSFNNAYPIVQNYYYSPFGEVWQGEKANDTNPFRYAGEYHDSETGSIYLRARYYNPSTGRFITVDPIKDGTNWYVYCSNNPIMFVDPWGLAPRPYEPEKWNNENVQYTTNCYAYALDFCGEITYGNYKGEKLTYNSSQPGAHRIDTKRQTTATLMYGAGKKSGLSAPMAVAGAQLDAYANGHTFKMATSENIAGKNLGENEWVVYLVAESRPGGDYHWYRQNPDGTWSHKPGQTPVTNREFIGINVYADGSFEYVYGDIITDPTTCSRQSYIYYYDENGELIHSELIADYDQVVGAYVVGYDE